MTAPDGQIPTRSYTFATLSQSLQEADQQALAIQNNQAQYDMAELARQAFFDVIYQAVQQIPIIGGIIGDLIEILSGVEDGDVNDVGTWVNTLLNAAGAIQIVIDIINDILALITGFVPGAGDAKQKLAGVINSKAAVTAVPIDSPYWGAENKNEIYTFPRSALNYGAASGTDSASGDGSHSHSLSQLPQYKPPGNGGQSLELAFMRLPKDMPITQLGFITGGSLTALGLVDFFMGVYKVNLTTGDLTLMNPASATVDQQDAVDFTNTEFRMNLGVTINGLQNEVYAVALLQRTSITQTCMSLACQTSNDVNRNSTSIHPRKPYAYVESANSLPATILYSQISWNASTKVFYATLGTPP